jgi:tripartite-type tricarboxylate transporter receptor subunit TctC
MAASKVEFCNQKTIGASMNFKNDGAVSWLRALGCGLVLAATATFSLAEDFPTRPVEMTVLFPAGSSADVVARALAEGMSKHLGQSVVVMNRPGAGGAIGYKYVLGQKADGYSIVFNSNSISTAYYSGMMPFDYKAFDPVARVTVELPVVAVKTSAPWKDLKEMVAHAKQKPDEIRVGNSGNGSHTHMSAVAFFADEGAEVTHIPYAAAQVVTSLLGGHIEAVVQLPSALAPHVKAGTLKILGVLAATREPVFPTVPTSIEQGFKFQAELWRGIAVRKGTPPAVVAKLEEALRKTVNSPEFKAQGDISGFLPAFQPAAEFGRTIATEDIMVGKVMDKLGLKKPQQKASL